MVFGWGKKKQVEEPVERKPVHQNISLSEVPKIIDDLSKNMLKKLLNLKIKKCEPSYPRLIFLKIIHTRKIFDQIL